MEGADAAYQIRQALGNFKDLQLTYLMTSIFRNKERKPRPSAFFYWNIFNLYTLPIFSLEEMKHINFDWYRPLNCFGHTPDKVQRWCRETGLSIEHMNVQESG